ncbi:hypothetical protein CP532_5303, partial [Ophiocordyceps camponoti-leonardi (nom. inval.)]
TLIIRQTIPPARRELHRSPAMPYRLDTHVLTVDANVIHKVDTANPANLSSMWTVEQGRRLENLSWRLWQRELLLEQSDNKPIPATAPVRHTLPRIIPVDSRLPDLPQLSGSVDSVQDEEAVEFTSVSAPLEIRPRIRRLDSSTSSRSRRDRHISSDDFEKMVVSIVKDKAPLSAPTQSSTVLTAPHKIFPQPASPPRPSAPMAGASPSQDSSKPATNVVRGFTPCKPSVLASLPPVPQVTIPDPASSPAPKAVQLKKQPAKFALGASCSPVDQDQKAGDQKLAAMRKPVFQIGGSSSEEGSLKSAFLSPRIAAGLGAPKKQTSFSNQIDTHTIGASDAAIDTDTEYVDESAIDDDDDDSSDWEDSVEDSGKSSVDDKFFQRVPSKVNLTSRPSLITLMLAQNERAKTLGNQASQSTSAIIRSRAGPSLGGSPNDSDEGPLMMKGGGRQPSQLKSISEVPRSGPQPIAVNRVPAQAALSPRTTRRNMLATELTESLRRHLLWERQQKSSTANAVLKRRHTSHDIANLRQFPERPCMKNEDEDGTSWNKYLTKEALNGYHSKGW